MLVVMLVVMMVLAGLGNLELSDRLQHAIALFQRLVVERRPGNIWERKLGVGGAPGERFMTL